MVPGTFFQGRKKGAWHFFVEFNPGQAGIMWSDGIFNFYLAVFKMKR